ncbi:Rieske (2Fe-2S) protein [Blastococcus xanthinilyticus]|uniref:Nitrite reductase (NADH) small subunit n=1 Tax=Blastococcus xanthinilyticus TaxID=1564164 RepID=A0A5S5CS83_9ACTN|nr:Rieske (2Fe-2S) protein [Blastococcus xanthinilyticus]TYP84633.1 nitrite reductase (NADH) small subunit [Blastococcus xanthinilyticus]
MTAAHVETARPTTPGTELGTPATEVSTPGPAAPVRGKEHVVGRVADIPSGEGRAFVAGGVQVAVFRMRDGSLHATQAACPHAGGPLADGQTDVDVLVCPLHLYAYRWSDGASTSGAAPVRVYPVREQDGAFVVTV